MLTLGQMGATNLDKWWRKMGMNLELGRGNREEKWSVLELLEMELARVEEHIGKPLVPVCNTNRY